MAKFNLPGRALRVLARRERRKLDAEWKRLAAKEQALEERSRILNDCEAGMHRWGKWKEGIETWTDDGLIPTQFRQCSACGLGEYRSYKLYRHAKGRQE